MNIKLGGVALAKLRLQGEWVVFLFVEFQSGNTIFFIKKIGKKISRFLYKKNFVQFVSEIINYQNRI